MTIADKLTQLNTIKQDIKTAINNKGGSVANDFTVYAAAITNLPSGGSVNAEIYYGGVNVVTIKPYNNTVKIIQPRNFQGWTYPKGLIIGTGFERVNEYAFTLWRNALTLSLPSTMITIDKYAFSEWNKATSLILPNSITSVGLYGFQNWTAAKSLTLGTGMPIINNYAFMGWQSLESLTIPNAVTSVGQSCFSGCKGLKTLTLSAAMTSIAAYCFQDCNSLVDINIHNNIKTIDGFSFSNCSSCKTITIGTGITTIGAQAFLGCTKLEQLKINATNPPTITNSTFQNMPVTCIIKVPLASLNTYKTAANWSAYASQIVGE